MAGYRYPLPRRYRVRYPYKYRKGGSSERVIGVVLGAVLVSAIGAKTAVTVTHHHAATPRHANTTAAPPVPAPAGGTLDCRQLEALWESAGGSPSAAFMAAEIATAESSGEEYAYLADSNGTADMGYWQINTSHGALATYNPYGNARAAVIISGDGTNWTPWVTYDHGAEYGKC